MIRVSIPAGMHAPASASREALRVRTQDGLALAVRRASPVGPSRGSVILCHGLSSNRFAFDYPDRSLADHLVSRGFECFLPDLRGAGDSDMPASGQWGLDEYLDYDLPAVLDLAQRQGRSDRLYWVGHSMGGILALLHAIDHPDLPVRRVVAIGSALDYRGGQSIYRILAPARLALPKRVHIPFGLFSRISARTASLGIPLPPEFMNFKRSNVEPDVRRTIMRRGFGPVPIRLLDDLATSLSPQGISRSRGAHRYLPRMTGYRLPTLLLGGEGDLQCAAAEIAQTARLLSHVDPPTVVLFGKVHGHVDDYGHFDLLVGRAAPREVWPHLTGFLEADDP